MKTNDIMTASAEFVNDPDVFIKLCDSPRKRLVRWQMVERDKERDVLLRAVYEALLAVGIALIIVAVIK